MSVDGEIIVGYTRIVGLDHVSRQAVGVLLFAVVDGGAREVEVRVVVWFIVSMVRVEMTIEAPSSTPNIALSTKHPKKYSIPSSSLDSSVKSHNGTAPKLTFTSGYKQSKPPKKSILTPISASPQQPPLHKRLHKHIHIVGSIFSKGILPSDEIAIQHDKLRGIVFGVEDCLDYFESVGVLEGTPNSGFCFAEVEVLEDA